MRGTRTKRVLAKTRIETLITVCGLLTLTVPVSARTIAVTTTDDVLALDGQCSLREAVTAANGNQPFSDCPSGEAFPVIDVIELPPGTYRLTLGAAGDDANLGGDLDITEAVTLRGLGDDFIWWDDPATQATEVLDVFRNPDGFPRTFTEEDLPDVVIENGLGLPSIPGDGDGVVHIFDSPTRGFLPSPTDYQGEEPPVFTFENLAIVGGDAFCTGENCHAGAAGIQGDALGDLTLRRVALFDNRIDCSGYACGTGTNYRGSSAGRGRWPPVDRAERGRREPRHMCRGRVPERTHRTLHLRW